jgi:hypothetical protein
MAIQGLERSQAPVNSPATDVEVMVDALERVGLVSDANRDEVKESTAADIAALESSGDGQDYPWIPDELVTLDNVVYALDTGEYQSGEEYVDTYVYNRLWTPGTDQDGYSAEDLDKFDSERSGSGVLPHVRRALHNPSSKVDPKLHFLNQPFDEQYAEEGAETQLQAIAKAQAEYEAAHEGFGMTPLNAKGVAMIALIQRIKGEDMPFEYGWLNDATMPRRTVVGDSLVGDVDSLDGQLRLDRSDGDAFPYDGVGLSVGPKEIEPQTS